jgi:hypothetical protein
VVAMAMVAEETAEEAAATATEVAAMVATCKHHALASRRPGMSASPCSLASHASTDCYMPPAPRPTRTGFESAALSTSEPESVRQIKGLQA